MGLEIEAPTPDKYEKGAGRLEGGTAGSRFVKNGTRVQLSTLQRGECESFDNVAPARYEQMASG